MDLLQLPPLRVLHKQKIKLRDGLCKESGNECNDRLPPLICGFFGGDAAFPKRHM